MNFENQIILGDSLEIMKDMEDDSIDLIVTDPPYGYSFMCRDWDKAVIPVPYWKEALRVLKPGAFCFVMSAPRQDVMSRVVCNLQDAGFNTGFTSMYWAYATGFTKASNIGKVVDRRECKKQLEKKLGRKPTKKEFEKVWKDFREVVGKYKPPESGEWNLKQAEGKDDNPSPGNFTASGKRTLCITQPATPEAKALNGSYAGFQPKPAVEVILVAMKPLSEKTYVDQALKNRKGITWMDDCKVPYESDEKVIPFQYKKKPNGYGYENREDNLREVNHKGRFPPNLLVSDDVMNDGYKKGTKPHPIRSNVEEYEGWGSITKKQGEIVNYGDSGSFSRYFDLDKWFCKTFPFFIVPKPSKDEKNRGLVGFEEKKSRKWEHDKGMKYTGNGKLRIEKDRNYHPTVKPIKLGTYLITLGSREGDVVLDPFVGSGTFCVSCKMLNRKYIGIDNKEEYVKISKARIKAVPLNLFSS